MTSETVLQVTLHGSLQKYFDQLHECWQKCVGQYFEGSLDFLVPPNSRHGTSVGTFLIFQIK
jgi:hypothetical protein